jgi:hypothetical protein
MLPLAAFTVVGSSLFRHTVESSPSMISAVNGVAGVLFFAGVFAFPVVLGVASVRAADGKIVLAGYLSVISLFPAAVGPLLSSVAILPAVALLASLLFPAVLSC